LSIHNLIISKQKELCSVLKLSLIFLLSSCENVDKPQGDEKASKAIIFGNPIQTFYTSIPDDKIEAPPQDKSNDCTTARGIYVGTSNDILKLVEEVKEFGVNAVVIDVKDELGDVTCDLALPPLYRKTIRLRNIGETIAKLRSVGIYTIARIVTFRDQYAVQAFEGFAIRNKDGSIAIDREKSSWLNPYNEKVWDYIIQIAKAAAKIGFNEIQFDYVRFSSYKNPNIDLGPRSKSVSRVEIINRFLDYAVQTLRPLGVKISVDVFGCIITGSLGEDTDIAVKKLGQEWGHIVKTVDYICPMIYPSHWTINSLGTKYPDLEPYKVVNSALQLAVKATKSTPGARAMIRPWLQSFTATWLPKQAYITYSQQQITDQISATTNAGATGWCFWNPAARYTAFIRL
jgi:hypothetical protein